MGFRVLGPWVQQGYRIGMSSDRRAISGAVPNVIHITYLVHSWSRDRTVMTHDS